MERLIFHVDVNSAFLSWEAARRVKEGLPDLREIPSCIGGDPKSRRGIVVAKSIPAKKYGVTTGEPVSMALRNVRNWYVSRGILRCLKLVPGHLKKYAHPMRRLWSLSPSMKFFLI